MERVILGIILLVGAATGQVPAQPKIVFDHIPPSGAPSAGDCLKVGSAGTLQVVKCAADDTPEPSAMGQNAVVPGTSLTCSYPGCAATTRVLSYQGSISAVPLVSGSAAPSNEVVMHVLEYGKTYTGKAVDVQIFPYHEEAGGILLGITPKVPSDWAIIETLYRETANFGVRDVRVFRTKTQVLHVGDFGPNGAWLSDPIPLKLEAVEQIKIRLVTESHVVEFWSDTSEVKAIKAR